MAIVFGDISAGYIGAMCHEYRRYYLKGITQLDIAKDCNMSREAVSKFERGTSPNAIIFLWYIKHGIFDWVPVEKWQGWEGALTNG